MHELIRLEAVTKNFKGFNVIKDINLSIIDKQCQGIIGPNGSGKTTILNIIAGIIYPSSGIIHENISAKNGDLGFSSGHSGFFPDLNFHKNLKLVYKVKGLSYDKKEVSYYSDLFRIDDSYNKPLKKYSTGMKQKLSIISALIGSPKLVILDEPTNGLDIDAVIALREVINELKTRVSIVITSHVLTELEEVCNDTHFIFNGTMSEKLNIGLLVKEFGSLENAYKEKKYVGQTN